MTDDPHGERAERVQLQAEMMTHYARMSAAIAQGEAEDAADERRRADDILWRMSMPRPSST